jgi:basic membrane lipoprotein Med (substrate-binding protein (PBP1-ABC) superfamily)
MAPTPRTRGRRITTTLAAASLALVLVACGSDSDESTDTTAAAVETAAPAETEAPAETAAAVETTVATGVETTAAAAAAAAGGDAPKLAIVYSAEFKDGSWGEAALKGAEALKAAGVISDFASQENVAPGADGERALRSYAEQGYNPIVAHSFNYGDDVKKVAKDFPDTIFVYAGGFGDVAGNVGDYSQPFFQASYLQGILSAGATESGNVAGAAGFDIPVCRGMYNAFLEGAKLVRPDTTGSFVAVGDWYDVQKAKEAALGQADQGATMYIGCGQAPTFGQIEATKDRGGVANGYVGDMSGLGETVVASFDWKLDKVFALMVDDVKAGKKEARYYEVSLKDGGMEVVLNPAWDAKLSEDVKNTFSAKLAEIQSGAFEVPFKGTE